MKLFKKAAMVIVGVVITSSLFYTSAAAASYTVLPKDSLYKIGLLFNTNANSLRVDNNLNSDIIFPGQTLDVPAKLHTVKAGESLFMISQKYGISLAALRQANNKWNDQILAGQSLIIPGGKANQVSSTPNSAKTIISYTQGEVDLLARLIQAEAGGESYEAKVAVGGVVVNRVQSSEWPSTISSVINQVINGYHQFTPVQNGHINKSASDDSIKAAWAALYGSDPSNNAIFYYDDSSTNQWMKSKTQTAHIDSMFFVK